MPIQVVKDPQTGEERRVYVPPSGMGETTTPAKPKAQPQPQPQRQNQSQPSFGLADLTGALPIFGMMNQLQITGGSIGAAVREFQRSGDLGKAYQAGQKQYIKELEQPGRAAQRVPAMAGRNIAQEVSDVVTADLPAALGVPGAKPTTAKRPDAPFLGVMPALPKAKSSGPAEDIATGIVQAGVEWFPAARAVGLVGKGAKLLPGAAKVAGAVRGATQAAAATKAAQAVAKIPGATTVGRALTNNTLTKAAATGALVDVAGFDQYGGRLTDLIDNAVKGTPLEGITLDYLKSDPNDVGMEGRLKNALEGGLFGTGLEVAFRTLRVARNFNWWRRAPEEQKAAAEEGLKQATKDLETEVAKQAYTAPVEPAAPNLPGASRPINRNLQDPTANQVAEVDVNAIQVDPKRFQFKAEGRKAEGGVAAPITDEQGFNPLKGGVVSVWTDPADGVTYVVNGHSRLAAAKESGYDKILVRQIQAETAEEARRIGALQNISEGQVTPKDAGTFVRQSGMTAQDMAAEGISLDNPAIAKQVDAEVKAEATAPTTVVEATPAAEPSVPSAGTSAAGPTAAEIAELDRTLAQARADLPAQQRVALRNQVLAQKYATTPEVTPAAAAPEPTLSSAPDQVDLPPEPGRTEPTLGGSGGEPPTPPPAVVEPPSFDEGWAQQLVRQMEQQRQGLEEGTITMDDLLENNVQKIVSPSGATSYVASPPTSAIQAYRAFSDVFTRPDATGIPVMSFERVQKDTEAWLSKVGYDGQAVLENLKQLSGPLGNYQENLVALRAAQLYADHSNLQAGIAANKWLNAAADESVDVGQLTAELLTAAAQQKAANLALESVTRPIGQLLYSLQNPRPTPGSLPFDEGLPPTKDLGKELEDALEVEAQTPVSESIGKALSPEAEEAILTGNYTPQVLAEVDQLARNMAQSAVTPGFAKGFWRQVNDSVAIGARGLVIYRASQLLSSGLTLWSNAINGVFRMVQMPLSQALGAAAQLEFSRVPQSLMMYGQYVSNLQNALRLGVESFKAGRGLYDLDQTSVDFLDKMAKQDLESTLLPPAVDRKAEWDLNTMPWLDVQDKSVWAIAQKRLWQTLNLSTRTQVSLDTFFKVLAGQSYEYVRNLQPGLDRAIQQGLAPGSKEAWQFAKEYAQAAVDRATRDVAIDGRTILDAVMTSPQAQSAMRYATFTDDIWAEMGPKTYEGGMQLAKAKGLEGAAAEEAVRKYLEAPAEVPFFGRTFSMMPAAWQKLIDFSPLFNIIQPFNRTPGDLVKSAARMGGLTAPLVDTWWRDLNSEDAFTRDRAIGDMAVGMAAISLGTIAMTHGRIQFTGGGPANPEAKKKWRDEGNQPYSFRVRTGDEWSPWVSMRVFEPLSTIFGAMADYQEIANKIPKEARERLGSALGMDLMLAVAAGQLSKTYYQGFSELYEAAMGVGEVDVGPNKRNPVERYISRILASMVPASSALRAGRRIEDPIVRDIPPSPVEGGLQGLPMRLFQETLGEIRNMIPGWSESLPPRRNWITGEPIVLSGILGDQYLPPDQPWLSTVFQFVPWSPFQVAPKQDPVLVEMAKLSGKGANFRGPQPTDWGRELRLDPVQFDQYVQTASNVKDQFGRTIYQALNDLINSEYYKSLPDEEVSTTVMSQKAAAIDLEVQKFRKLGKEAFEANNPALVRDLRNIEGLNKDVQYRLKYGQPIDVNRFTEALR